MLHLRPYTPTDREACLALFDSNVPAYFAPHERDDFVTFLDDDLVEEHLPYFVLTGSTGPIACGGIGLRVGEVRMCWGIVSRLRHGERIGTFMLLARLCLGAKMGATRAGLDTIPKTVPFFERFGFVVVGGEDDHYGPGIHRRDLQLAFDSTTIAHLHARLAEAARDRFDLGLAFDLLTRANVDLRCVGNVNFARADDGVRAVIVNMCATLE